jgi:glycosyltransferase involved in cell wall biosynthesis
MSSPADLSVLYVAFDTVPSPKGASTHITQFVRALHSRHATTLISVNRAPCIETGRYMGIPHIRVGFSEPNFLKRVELFREFISRHVKEHRYHIIHFRSIWEGIPILDFRKEGQYQSIYEVNGLPSLELPYHYPELRKNTSLLQKLKSQEVWTIRNSDRIITPSDLTASFIRKAGAAEDRISIIPNGVDTDLFKPCDQEEDEGLFTVLYAGTLAPWQGIKMLLLAFREVIAKTEARLLILGTGKKWWLRQYIRLCKKLDISEHVHFLPAVDHAGVAEYIRKAHACVAPLEASERNVIQGCNPIKVLEYMACRKAIVATDIPVIRSLLTHGRNSLLFPEGRSDELARCLMELKLDVTLRQQLAREAYRKIDNYRWSLSCARLLNLYEEMGTGKTSR